MTAESCGCKSSYDEDSKHYVFDFYLLGCRDKTNCTFWQSCQTGEAIVFAFAKTLLRNADTEAADQSKHLPACDESDLVASQDHSTLLSIRYHGDGRYRVRVSQDNFSNLIKIYAKAARW